MTHETTFDQLDRENRARLEWIEFNAQRENETRLQFVTRIAAMMLRSSTFEGGMTSMWAGNEFFTADDVADELEFLTNQQEITT